MFLDPNKLDDVRFHDGKLIARCPACAQQDRNSDHLTIYAEGEGGYRCKTDPIGKGSEHNKLINKRAGIGPTPVAMQYRRYLNNEIRRLPPCCPAPGFQKLEPEEFTSIRKRAAWSSSTEYGLACLSARGLVYFSEIYDAGHKWESWVITDRSQLNAAAIRIDGEYWSDGSRSKTLPGCDDLWPIGAANIGDLPIVVVCSGHYNFASILAIADQEGLPCSEIAPVCMDYSEDIPKNALGSFSHKRVRILVPGDDTGLNIFKRWAQQFRTVGATVDGRSFGTLKSRDGNPVQGPAGYLQLLNSKTPPQTPLFDGLFLNVDMDVA